jgi:phosphoribosylformylglycinamidine synthase
MYFGDPTVPAQMGAFVAAVDGLADVARELDVPFVSGNVSLYNRSASGNAVAPSPIVGCIGRLADVANCAAMGFKRPGSAIVVTAPLQLALGGSVVAELLGIDSTTLPALDVHAFARQYRFVAAALASGAISSAHLVGDGGVLAAIAKMAFASFDGLGFRVDPQPMLRDLDHDAAWFSEIPGFVVEVADLQAFAELGARMHVAAFDAGSVLAQPYAMIGDEQIPLAELRDAWEAPLRDFYGSVA